MGEGAALQVHEGFLARGMHELEDELGGIGGDEVEIVVVFAGEGSDGGVEGVERLGDARGFSGRDGSGDARFRHHAGNCNGARRVGQIAERKKRI